MHHTERNGTGLTSRGESIASERSDLKYDDGSLIHHAAGARVAHAGSFLVWTFCQKDVPANRSFVSDETVTCPDCIASAGNHASDCEVWVRDICSCLTAKEQNDGNS
jgi:hypothetical protein